MFGCVKGCVLLAFVFLVLAVLSWLLGACPREGASGRRPAPASPAAVAATIGG